MQKEGNNMICELDKTDYPKVVNLFTRLRSNTAIESIFKYKNEARLFVDNPEKPESVFILDSWAYYYLAGETGNEDFNSSLLEFLENEFFPECIRTNYNTEFAFYPDTDQWCKKTEKLFSHMNLEKSGKTYFYYNENSFNKNWRNHIPEGFSTKRISPDIIDSIDNNQEFVDYIKFAWKTVDKFFDKGMGYCAVDDQDFATICISAFASENEREVGIKTFPDFRRKGLAYVTACAYIEECLENRLIPVWSCFSDNQVSVKLADKLGYTIESSHPIYFTNIGE
jgi:RimJ/RimL family protein N-acetyltransferase